MADVKVIKIGLGEVVSNWGTHNGVPAIFLETVQGQAGISGAHLKDGEEPQITADRVSDGGIIIEFHGSVGAEVIREDIASAMSGKANKEVGGKR